MFGFKLFGRNRKDGNKGQEIANVVASADALYQSRDVHIQSENSDITDEIEFLLESENAERIKNHEEWIERFNALKTLDEKLFMIQLTMFDENQNILWSGISIAYNDILQPYCELIDIEQLSKLGENIVNVLEDIDIAGMLEQPTFTILNNADFKTKKYIDNGLVVAESINYTIEELTDKMEVMYPNHPAVLERKRFNALNEGEKFLLTPYFTDEQIGDLNLISIQTFKANIPHMPCSLSTSQIEIFKNDLNDFMVNLVNNSFNFSIESSTFEDNIYDSDYIDDIFKMIEQGEKRIKREQEIMAMLKERFNIWYLAQSDDVKKDIIESFCQNINSFNTLSDENIEDICQQLHVFLSDITIKQAKNSIIDPKYIFDLPEITRIKNVDINSPEADEKVLSQNHTIMGMAFE